MVHKKVMEDILLKKDEKLKAIEDAVNFPRIVSQARQRWQQYEPIPRSCTSIGVDGSYSIKQFQGIDLYVTDAVAVDSVNNILKLEFDHNPGVVRVDSLGGLSLRLEASVMQQVLNDEELSSSANDLLLVDGSISAWLNSYSLMGASGNNNNNNKKKALPLIEAIKSNNAKYGIALAFVSKNSDTSKQFANNNNNNDDDPPIALADLFYYNHIDGQEGPGFSLPFQDDESFDSLGVTIIEVYARLKAFTPLIKIELINATGHKLEQAELDGMAQFEIRHILSKMVYHSVSGYPNCLRLAHDNCTITSDYMNRVVHLYGFNNEIGSRAPLHERTRVNNNKTPSSSALLSHQRGEVNNTTMTRRQAYTI
jgi:NurA-like 5'-3' nuclease